MIIEIVKDKRERWCSCCLKKIHKGDIIVKYDYIVDDWKNSRMWFAHIDCLINELKKRKREIKNIKFDIRRFNPK